MNPRTPTAGLIAAAALLWSCAPSMVEVSAVGQSAQSLVAPFALTPGSDAATAAALEKHGLIVGEAPLLLTATRSVQSAKVGICGTPDAAMPGGCAQWRKPPQTGWHPFGTPNTYRLVLDFTDIASGRSAYRVEAMLRAKGTPPAGLTQQLVDAALACTGCTGGQVIGPAK